MLHAYLKLLTHKLATLIQSLSIQIAYGLLFGLPFYFEIQIVQSVKTFYQLFLFMEQ